MAKKLIKAGDFKETADILLSSLGGNRSSPACGATKIDINATNSPEVGEEKLSSSVADPGSVAFFLP
jgi:hypothetical protein